MGFSKAPPLWVWTCIWLQGQDIVLVAGRWSAVSLARQCIVPVVDYEWSVPVCAVVTPAPAPVLVFLASKKSGLSVVAMTGAVWRGSLSGLSTVGSLDLVSHSHKSQHAPCSPHHPPPHHLNQLPDQAPVLLPIQRQRPPVPQQLPSKNSSSLTLIWWSHLYQMKYFDRRLQYQITDRDRAKLWCSGDGGGGPRGGVWQLPSSAPGWSDPDC